MHFDPVPIDGAFLLIPEPAQDARGSFARLWSARELRDRGIAVDLAHVSVSFNRRRGTLRGLHYQRAPHEESKIVGCLRGAVYDVIVDLRPASPSYRHWFGVTLDATSPQLLYVPPGCAHGFQTLSDAAEVLYLIAGEHAPDHAAGIRWDDPAFGITWPPEQVRTLSPRDRTYPDYAG